MNALPANLFERQFVNMLERHGQPLAPEVKAIISKLLRATITQHSCLQLHGNELELMSEQVVVGDPRNSPLTISESKLYLSRFFILESEVAQMIAERNRESTQALIGEDQLKLLCDEFEDPRQRLATYMAATRDLCIVTGGPGTGKTSTIAKVLAAIPETSDLIIRLAAPTGKAAMRLAESLQQKLPHTTQGVETLHRLLGMRRDGRSWRHHQHNQVAVDLLVIDEASMIDLSMMHRLLLATPEPARLILLGDPDQLPSVDTGNVLADLCHGNATFSEAFLNEAMSYQIEVDSTANGNKMTDAVCKLTRSFRFEKDSCINQIAAAIIEADPTFPAPNDDFSFQDITTLAGTTGQTLATYWQNYLALLETGDFDASKLQSAFDACRILTSQRSGEYGVEQLNKLIEEELTRRGLKSRELENYPGRPILITSNDYNLGLFNGDVGICTPGQETDEYLVTFPGSPARELLVSRLPSHETCFAMTIHKSQGSEFDQVVMILQEEAEERLITRELLYTAVTRSKRQLSIYSTEALWQAAVARSSSRVSGMADFLANAPTGQLELFPAS